MDSIADAIIANLNGQAVPIPASSQGENVIDCFSSSLLATASYWS